MARSSYSPARMPLWRRTLRRLAKQVLAWRYRRFTPDSEPGGEVKVGNLRLTVLRSVFDPSVHFTSDVLASYLARPGVVVPGASVLDLGTGTGVAAIAAGMAGAGRVVASDINPAAVTCARQNVRRYGLEDRITVREGDMFAPVEGEQFDLAVCNPPYFSGEPRSMAERAYRAGPMLEWLTRFGKELHKVLAPRGRALVVLGDAADIDTILDLLSRCGWLHNEVSRRDILVETIYVFEMTAISKVQ